jgi:hypothetical protein
MGVMPVWQWTKAVLRGGLYSSFGAGLGIGLGIVLMTAVSAALESGPPHFDCSTVKLCGLSFANSFLLIITIILGACGILIFASLSGFLYALPMAVIGGGILAMVARANTNFWKSWPLHILIGAVFGVIWWVILIKTEIYGWFDGSPFAFFFGHPGLEEPSKMQAPTVMQVLSSPIILLPALGGIVSAEMFRRWMATEVLALQDSSV